MGMCFPLNQKNNNTHTQKSDIELQEPFIAI